MFLLGAQIVRCKRDDTNFLCVKEKGERSVARAHTLPLSFFFKRREETFWQEEKERRPSLFCKKLSSLGCHTLNVSNR